MSETQTKGLPAMYTAPELAKCIEHTLVKPDATETELALLVKEAMRYGFYAVVVNSGYVAHARKLLGGAQTRVVATVAFPFGTAHEEAKAAEACIAVEQGADEIDMVMNVGRFKSGDEAFAKAEVEGVKRELEALEGRLGKKVPLKVIIETPLLTPEEIGRASLACVAAGADFIKTSTGFAKRPTSLEDVRLIKEAVGGTASIKASGGIRTYEQAIAFLEAGATRIGASRSVEIVEAAG
jgi:deoxyribose-phosphate aldolase